MNQNFTHRAVLRKHKATFELWRFAARYSLIELEQYYRKDAKVFATIKKTLRTPSEGIESFLKQGMPIAILNEVIRDVVSNLDSGVCNVCLLEATSSWGRGLCKTCAVAQDRLKEMAAEREVLEAVAHERAKAADHLAEQARWEARVAEEARLEAGATEEALLEAMAAKRARM